tara:strand:+ start:2951 stop:4618 length:1668 start_codon:yes stop_codon:yes gene_type:complete
MTNAEKKLYDIAEASDALADSATGLEEAMVALSGSKGWSVISRMVSGVLPGFWSFQNKLRGMTGIFEMYYTGQRKAAKEAIKTLEATKKLDDLTKSMRPIQGLVNEDLSALTDSKKIKDFANIAAQNIKQYSLIKQKVLEAQEKRDIDAGKVGAIRQKNADGSYKFSQTGTSQGDSDRLEVLKEIKFLMGNQVDEIKDTKLKQVKEYLKRRKHRDFERIGAHLRKKQTLTQVDSIGSLVTRMGEESQLLKDRGREELQAFKTFFAKDPMTGKREKLREQVDKFWKKSGKLMEKGWDGMKKMGIIAVKIMLFITLFITFTFFMYRAIKDNKAFFGTLMDTLRDIWGLFVTSLVWIAEGIGKLVEGFQTGNFLMVLEGLGQIFLGVLGAIFWPIAGILVGLIGGLLGLIFGGIVEAVATGEGMLAGVLQMAGWILALTAAILYILSPAGWVTIGLLIAGAILSLLGSLFLGKHAGGGTVTTPMQLVGEKGPELVSLPMGSRVYTNQQSKAMTGTTNVTVQVSGRVGASDAEIKDIANKVAREINLRMNRTGTTGTGF